MILVATVLLVSQHCPVEGISYRPGYKAQSRNCAKKISTHICKGLKSLIIFSRVVEKGFQGLHICRKSDYNENFIRSQGPEVSPKSSSASTISAARKQLTATLASPSFKPVAVLRRINVYSCFSCLYYPSCVGKAPERFI